MEKKKYEVTIVESVGSCDSNIFKKMAQKGDITSDKIETKVDTVVEITGYAICHIVTDEKDFDLGYYATNEGIISTGSEVFKDSIVTYIDDVQKFAIKKIKTKKGTTYKAVPVLSNETNVSYDVETGEVNE